MTTVRRASGVASLAILAIAGLAGARATFAQVAETGVVTVRVFDDGGTPADTSDDIPTAAPVAVFGDDEGPSPDWDDLIAEGHSTPEEPLVVEDLAPGWYWIVFESPPGHSDEESFRFELNTDPTLDCHVGDASTPGCVAGSGNTIVSIGLGPPEGVRRITLAVIDESGDPLWGGTFEVRRDDGDGRLEPAADVSVFGPLEDTEDDGFVTDQLEPGSYWVVEVRPPDDFASHDPLLVELNLDPTKSCVAGDTELWNGPLCGDGQGYTQVFILYPFSPSPGDPSPTERPAATVPPTDARNGSTTQPRETGVPWLVVAGSALTLLGAILLTRPHANRRASRWSENESR